MENTRIPHIAKALFIIILISSFVLMRAPVAYAATLSSSPASGAPGTAITISGSAFLPNTSGVVWFDSDRDAAIDAGEPQISVTTTAAGAIPAGTTLTIPNVVPGIYPVHADIPSGGSIEASANFTVSSPSITLSPTSGVPGTAIVITGTGFTLNSAGQLWFDSNGNNAWDAGEPQVTVTTTAAGALPSGITLTIPAVAAGSYQVRADIPSGASIEASANFTLSSPSITLSPTSGAPGTVMTITGSAFLPNTSGVVWFDSNGNGAIDAGEPQVSVTTTAAGAIPDGVALSIPNVAPAIYAVRADVPSGGSIEASASFTVPSSSITLSPTSGVPGTVITITGSGLAPNTSGVVWFDSDRNGAADVGEPQVSVTTTAAGALPSGTILTIPAVAAGSYQVRADIPSGASIEASANFTVPILAIALSPTSGVPGTVITITGSGLSPNTSGVVWFDSNGNGAIDAGEPQASVTSTSGGFISTGVIVDVPNVIPGIYAVQADVPGGGSIEASASFTVLSRPSAAPLLGSSSGEIILATSASIDVLIPASSPFMGTLCIQSSGLRYDIDIWTGTAWNTVVEAGARNACYQVAGFGLRMTNDTTTSITVTYMLVYLR